MSKFSFITNLQLLTWRQLFRAMFRPFSIQFVLIWFALRMGETSPKTIVFKWANYLSWRLLTSENYDIIYISTVNSHPLIWLEILHTLPNGYKLNTIKQYEIYKHYKQSPTNILNYQLHYKTHILFGTITHASHINTSTIPTTMSQKTNPITANSTGIVKNCHDTHDTKKLLLNTWVSEDVA
jgi:hypothetical protein